MQGFHCMPTSSDSWPCPDTPESNQNEGSNEASNPEDLPLSSAFPAFTAINRRRRIRCKFCDLPIGYADITMAHLEASRCSVSEACHTTSDDKRFQSISIPRPINVSLNPRRIGSCDSSEDGNKFMTWIMENAAGNTFNADEVICDGCGSSLGAKITSFERKPGSLDATECEISGELEDGSYWYSFALDRVNIEPFFGLVGLRELSSWYYGGERFSHEFQAIEDSEEWSNDSRTWLRPYQRVKSAKMPNQELINGAWPFFQMDLVRASELPEGTLGHVDGKTMAYLDNLDAFKRKPVDLGVGDDSIATQHECICEAEADKTVVN